MSAKEVNAKKWLRQIKQIILGNGFFRKCFPEIRPGGKWDELEIEITRDVQMTGEAQASITATTLLGGQASQHWNHLILDDPVNEKMAQSEDSIENATERYEYIESLLKDWETSSFLFVGTPYGRGDPMEYAIENEVSQGHRLFWGIGAEGDFTCSKGLDEEYPWIVPKVTPGEPILPSEVPREYLEYMKKKDLETYYLQYLCKPYELGRNGFDLDLIRDYILDRDGFTLKCECHAHHHHDLRDGSVIATWDPAVTEDKKNCRNAIAIMVEFECGCRFYLDEWADWVETDKAIDKMTELAQKWQPYLRLAAIETVGFQHTLKKWLETLQNEGKFPPSVQFLDLKPQGRSKNARIKSQQTPVANGLWHIRPNMRSSKAKQNTMWELEGWPYRKERDLVDTSFGYCEDAWADPRAHKAVRRNDSRKNWNKLREERDRRKFATEV